MTTTHAVHDRHAHAHGEGCGHLAIAHGEHMDYLHDGHSHHAHGEHWDECPSETQHDALEGNIFLQCTDLGVESVRHDDY
ncbi:MAG: threonine dehydratase [Acidimicrobiaceae bacterium]|jgi:hypothetical protein|nr:threonine dehydratase [Acidimicrobiaceae bacterium]